MPGELYLISCEESPRSIFNSLTGVTKAGVPAGVAEEAELCLLLFFVAV